VGVARLDELPSWGGLCFDDCQRHLDESARAWIHHLAKHDEARLCRLFDGLKSATPLPLQVARWGGDAPCLEALLAVHPRSPEVLITARSAGLNLPAEAVKSAIGHHEANAAWRALAAEMTAQERIENRE
jgi:hypothetical protein